MVRGVATFLLGVFGGGAVFAADHDPGPPAQGAIRVATYNVAMYRNRAGQLRDELESGESEQAKRIAEVLQRVRPDVVLLNEFDYEAARGGRRLVESFKRQYLSRPQAAGVQGVDYPHHFFEPVNTGVDSGLDLDQDGVLGGPADAWGYGRYPGQYGMLLLSRLPLGTSWRTYQKMEWRNLADARWPKFPGTDTHYYSEEQRRVIRLASKSFWDVEVQLPTTRPGHRWRPLRILCAHPTPPVFDGPEDRNGCRNYDEIRMIAEYISGSQRSSFPVDDNPYLSEGEGYETLRKGAEFVVLGDLNADPLDGSGAPGAIDQLLKHPRINATFTPRSDGGTLASQRNPNLNAGHQGDPACDTADFGRDGFGNLRVDYVLPSKGLRVVGSGIYWPSPDEPGAEAIEASDHRMVWVDVVVADD